MKQYELPVTKPVFRLKGGSLAATVLELACVAPALLAEQLAQKVAQAPQLLRHSPLIIDLDKLGDADGELDLGGLLAACRLEGLQPVALRAHRAHDLAQAQCLGLAVLPPARSRERTLAGVDGDAGVAGVAAGTAPGATDAAEVPARDVNAGSADPIPAASGRAETPAPEAVSAQATGAGATHAGRPAGAIAGSGNAIAGHDGQGAPDDRGNAPGAPASRPTRVVTQPVRGGQQIYADGDLVLLAPVSAGAEVMAEGHIHCYAPLRGRALAGVQGDTGARVFCRELSAELVAIAGHYRIADDLKADALWGKAAQVSLHDGQLRLVAL